MSDISESRDLRDKIAERYGRIARDVMGQSRSGGCCSSPCASGEGSRDPVTSDLYSRSETDEIPQAASAASLGCGNPTALAELREGETVLDLGSGGGLDVLLSARRVGPTGKAYGLDMTDEMLELARRNQADAGLENVEFLQGTIENIPLPDRAVDVIISNCVINLSSDKAQVLREAHRVLAPGGRFAVSDIVVRGELDPRIRRSIESWIGCVAGALTEDEYVRLLEDAGFADIEIEPTRVFQAENVVEMQDVDAAARTDAGGEVVSAFIRATRPR